MLVERLSIFSKMSLLRESIKDCSNVASTVLAALASSGDGEAGCEVDGGALRPVLADSF